MVEFVKFAKVSAAVVAGVSVTASVVDETETIVEEATGACVGLISAVKAVDSATALFSAAVMVSTFDRAMSSTGADNERPTARARAKLLQELHRILCLADSVPTSFLYVSRRRGARQAQITKFDS